MADGATRGRPPGGWGLWVAAAVALTLVIWLLRGSSDTPTAQNRRSAADSGQARPTASADNGGPIIGAFHSRIGRRLAAAAVPTAPLRGALRIRARDVRWLEADGTEFARAREVTGDLQADPLRRGDVRLTGVTVTAPTVRLTSDGESWNYEVVLADLLDGNDAPLVPERIVALDGVIIRGGTVDVRMPDRSFVLEELQADLRSIAFAGPGLPEPRLVLTAGTTTLFQREDDRRVSLRAEDGSARILEESVAFTVANLWVEGARFASIEGRWSPEIPWYGVEAAGRAVDVDLSNLSQFLPKRGPMEGSASFDFSIRAASATAADVVLENLTFQSQGSNISGAVTLRMLPRQVELRAADLRVDPLDLALAGAFVDSLPLGGQVRGTLRGSGGDIRFDLVGQLSAAGAAEPFRVRLTGQAAFDAGAIAVRNAEAELTDVPLPALRPYLAGLPLAGTVSGRIALTGPPARAPLNVAVTLSVATGVARVEGTLDLTGAVPAYDLTGELSGIDVQRLLATAAPPVVINGRFAIDGSGATPEAVDARVRVAAGFSGWRSSPGDTLIVAARARSGTLNLDTVRLRLATLSGEASGAWRFLEPATGEVRYAAEISSLIPWGPYVPLIGDTAAAGRVTSSGTMAGTLNRPRIQGDFTAADVRVGDWSAAGLELDATLALGAEVPEGRIDLNVRDLVTPTAGVYPDVTGVVTLARPEFALELRGIKAAGGTVEVAATGRLPAVGPRDLVLQRAHVDLTDGRWALAAPATVRWGDQAGRVAVEQFEMRQSRGDGRIRLDGQVLPLAEADFRVETAALPLGELQELLGITPYATGQLWTETSVTGPATAPTIDLQFRLDGGTIQDVGVSRVEGTLRYANTSLAARAVAAFQTEGSLELHLALPASIDLTAEQKFAVIDSGAVTGTLAALAVTLTPFTPLVPQVRDLVGRIDGRVTLTGSVGQPAFDGRLVLTDASVRLPALHRTFTPVRGQLALDGRRVIVEDFTVTSDGRLTVSGEITFEDLTSPVAQLSVRMEQFRPVEVANRPDAALWGDLTLTGPWEEPVLSGALRVADGYVVIPQFDAGFDAAFADLQTSQSDPGADRSALVDRIEIRDLEIEVGTDVWFAAEAARAQLGGRVTLNRERNAFSIQGDLEGRRGQYTLQAGPIVRRFEILNARVRFLGSPDVNPALDITARRVVFDPAGRQIEVEVRIGGTMRTPTLSLTSADAPAFPESELLSVLFFGRQTLELGGGGLPGETVLEGALLSGLAELASLEIEEAIVRNLGLSLDIFQVRFGPGGIGGFGAPTFVFGWELGSDVFLTAESAIGALLDETQPSTSAWALRLEWAFDRRSRARIGLEPVAPYRSLRGFGLAPISRQPLAQQLSLEVRRRWTY